MKIHIFGREKAKEIALNYAQIALASVSRIDVELDYDDGKLVYEVDFRYGNIEYDYEIDAITGAILQSERENDGSDGDSNYDDTDYGTSNDGITDYGESNYDDTDYGANNDGVTDYNDTDYGANNDGVTDYNGDSNYSTPTTTTPTTSNDSNYDDGNSNYSESSNNDSGYDDSGDSDSGYDN